VLFYKGGKGGKKDAILKAIKEVTKSR